MRRQPQYPCPTCGNAARIQVSPDARGREQYACARCGMVLPPLPFPTEGGNFHENPTPIRQGMKAMIGGKEFISVGMIRYEEPEDEGAPSVWYEFVLMDSSNDVRYLEYDPTKLGNQWSLTEPFAPRNTGELIGLFGAGTGVSGNVDGASFQVEETGTGTITGFAGQIPWPIRLGEQIQYVDMKDSTGRIVSGEVSPSGEMEWFRGGRMDDRAVLSLFGLTHLLTELNRREERKKGQYSFGCVTMLVAILAFILACVGGCGKGKVVASGSAVASQIDEDGKRFGPFKLTQANRVYRLRVSTSLSSTSMQVQGVIENADASQFFDVDSEFWDESGYDSDGAWHESELEANRDFRLDQPKEVYVRLYADPEAQAANAPVSFAIEEGVLSYGPFVAFGIVGSIIGFIWLCIAGSTKKVWDGMS